MDTSNTVGSTIVATVAGIAAVAAGAALFVIYTGIYNVAATEEHTSLARWAMETTFHNSVARRADEVAAPDGFPDELIDAGAAEYAATCERCHGGPGAERAEWASGIRPRPPYLAEAAAHWSPQEVFWIVKHGVKMTGMPAFGPTHGDDELWSLAAFVTELPAMTPERYARLQAASSGHAR